MCIFSRISGDVQVLVILTIFSVLNNSAFSFALDALGYNFAVFYKKE